MKDGQPGAGTGPHSPELSRKEKRKLSRAGSEELVKEGSDGKRLEGRAFLSRRVTLITASVRRYADVDLNILFPLKFPAYPLLVPTAK